MQQQAFSKGKQFKNGSSDAGYGSEKNYAWLEKHGQGNYFKYNTFHYDQERDEFLYLTHNRMV